MRISDWSSDVCSSDLIIETDLPGVLIVEPKVFGDGRGFFMESWNARAFEAAGIAGPWVQDNHSRSARGVLRGLHYQVRQTQGKLVRATADRTSVGSGMSGSVRVDIGGRR